MTNYEHITSSKEVLSNFITQVAYARYSPWSSEFSKQFCDNCPTTRYRYEGTNEEDDFHECDFSDGVCPNGDDIDWWLSQEVKETE